MWRGAFATTLEHHLSNSLSRCKRFLFLPAIGMLSGFAMAASSCDMALKATLPITFTSSALHPTIQGSINGTPTPVLVDTGSYKTFMVQAALEQRGIAMRPSSSSAGGVSGRTVLFDAHVDSLTVGPATGSGMFEVLQTPRGDFPFGVVVGADYMLRSDMEISLAAKHLKFFSPNDCANAHLAYWDPKANWVPFEAPTMEGDLRPEMMVRLNGHPVRAIIDTGASHSFVDLGAAKRASVTPLSQGVVVVGQGVSGIGDQPRKIWRAPFASVAIGSAKFSNVKLHMVDLGGAGEKLVLGADFLRSHRILLSMSQRRMYFSYLGGPVFSELKQSGSPWFLGEALNGNADAQYRMGRMLEAGGEVAPDRKQALVWYRKAARLGQPQARERLRP
jgi:predicted aspartyl protease